MKPGLLLGGLERNWGCQPCEAPSGSCRTLYVRRGWMQPAGQEFTAALGAACV